MKKFKEYNEIRFLARAVSHAEEDMVDKWFMENPITSPEVADSLVRLVLEAEMSFYSFSSPSMDRAELDEEKFRREKMLLSHFELKQQLDLITCSPSMDTGFKHIELLKYDLTNYEHKALILKSNTMGEVLGQIFNEQRFTELDDIQKFLDLNLLEKNYARAMVFYRQDNSRGMRFLDLPERNFKPYYDIIFNYSDEKRDYLASHGIALPSSAQALVLSEKILLGMNQGYDKKTAEYMQEGLKTYLRHASYYDLQRDLATKEDKTKKMKV